MTHTFYLYQFNLSNSEVLCVLQSCQSLDCQFARQPSTDHALLASSIKVKKNFKALLMKANESFGDGVVGEILNSLNESLDRGYHIKQ